MNGTVAQRAEDIRVAVLAIQGAYVRMGLRFHIGKTLVSSTTFEYLGDVGDDGRFIDTSAKPLSGMGILETNGGINPFGSVCDTFIGQMSACVKSSFPAHLLSPFTMESIYQKLRRTVGHIDPVDSVGLMILPKSAGGIGLPDNLSMTLTAQRDQFAEFVADLSLLEDSYPSLVGRLCGYFNMNKSSDEKSLHKYIKGNVS